MASLLALVMMVAHTITCLRLLLYRRDGSRYRPAISAAAWILIVSTGTTALELGLGLYPAPAIHLGDAGMALMLCLLSLRARGDVAHLLRTRYDR